MITRDSGGSFNVVQPHSECNDNERKVATGDKDIHGSVGTATSEGIIKAGKIRLGTVEWPVTGSLFEYSYTDGKGNFPAVCQLFENRLFFHLHY